MKSVFFVFCFYTVSFGVSFFDSVLFNISDQFKNQIETNPNFKIYACFIDDLIQQIQIKKNRASIVAQKILILAILQEAYCKGIRDISILNIKKEFYKSFKKICKKKFINDNYFSLLMIVDAYDRLFAIEKYTDYAKNVASHWFNKNSYFEDEVEYVGPQLKKSIDDSKIKIIDENVFGPVYIIFIYALTKVAYDSIK
jgi:hypothetical protein